MFQNARSYADTMHAIAKSCCMYSHKKENNKFSRIGNNLKIIKPWIISSISLLTIKAISPKIAQNA